MPKINDYERELPKMSLLSELYAMVSLGLICGWYFFILILVPILIYFIVYDNGIAHNICTFIFVFLGTLTVLPLDHTPNTAFMYARFWKPWRDYFGYTYDIESVDYEAMKNGKRFIFFEFPHAIFPMGQFLSASLIEEMFPGQMITGTAADIVFQFPVMRQLMAWIGTRPARKESFTKIFASGHHGAVVPGGIAEMYLVSEEVSYFICILLVSLHSCTYVLYMVIFPTSNTVNLTT
jgi:hypothetical protein